MSESGSEGREHDVASLPIEAEPDVLRWPGTHEASNPPGQVERSVLLATPPLERELTAGDLGTRRRRVVLPLGLFAATCASTFLAGALSWNPGISGDFDTLGRMIAANWQQGLIYMAAVMGILLTHEMGHFLQTLRYRVHASLPFFIPVPFLLTGTMGAVIGMEGSRADRKQLFDIGISGPWAGLIVALPIIWFGVMNATFVPSGTQVLLGDPLIFKMMTHYLRPDIPADAILNKSNPLLMAGWVGMLVTGLNMLPISQLDGGHVIYGLFGRRSRFVARSFMIAAILFVVIGDHYNWTLMLVLVILMGVDHPPTRDDNVSLGWWRRILGLVSLALPVLCFTPVLI
jgi:membrane-associated protease RseP (regulator of RpoE activity)